MHYFFKVTVTNDTDTAKTLRAYIGPGGFSPLVIPVIRYGTDVKWCNPRRNSSTDEWWHWLEDELAPGISKTYDYEFIPAAQGASPILHGWRAE